MDDGLLRHCGVVASAVGIVDGAALHVQVGLGQIGHGGIGGDGGDRLVADFAWLLVDIIGGRLAPHVCHGVVVVVTVAASIGLADKDLPVVIGGDGRGLDVVDGTEVGIALLIAVGGIVSITLCLLVRNGSSLDLRAEMYVAVPREVYAVLVANYLGGKCHRYFVALIQRRVNCLAQLRVLGFFRTDTTGDVVAAEYVIDEHVVGGILAVNMHVGAAAHIGLAGSAEHLLQVASLHRHVGAAGHMAFVATAIYVATNNNGIWILLLRYAK